MAADAEYDIITSVWAFALTEVKGGRKKEIMDILLVNAPVKGVSRHAGLEPPLGLAYIASVLLANGYTVSAVDFNVTGFNPMLLEGILKKDKPRILGISAHTETYLNGLKIAEIAKQIIPEITVIMGGTHPTILYGEVLRKKSIDIVVRGEGEYTMLELADCIIGKKDLTEAGKSASAKDEADKAAPDTEGKDANSANIEETGSQKDEADKDAPDTEGKECDLSQIKGIAYRENGVLKTTPKRPFIEDIDELPFPAKELFPLPLYKSSGNILMSRGGCPFDCRFCAVNNIWGGKRRFRKPEKVVEEILHILKSGQSKEIAFADDVFTLDRQRAIELCDLLKTVEGPTPLRWTCASRVDLVDRELLEKMHDAGCFAIQFGVEAGSQRILDSMGKGITLEQVREAVKNAIDVGMTVLCAFMFPQPLDTELTIREQGEFMNELLAMGAKETLTFTTPLPGTYYFYNADMRESNSDMADNPEADELGISILASNWDEYDAKHLLITTKYLSKKELDSLFEELIQTVGLTTDDAQWAEL